VSVIGFSTWILRWQCVPALLCYLYSHLYTYVICLYCINSHCYWSMTRQMFYMLHEVADLFHICKIQWNIIKRRKEEVQYQYSTVQYQYQYSNSTVQYQYSTVPVPIPVQYSIVPVPVQYSTVHSSPIKVLSTLQIQIWRSSRMGEGGMRYMFPICSDWFSV